MYIYIYMFIYSTDLYILSLCICATYTARACLFVTQNACVHPTQLCPPNHTPTLH